MLLDNSSGKHVTNASFKPITSTTPNSHSSFRSSDTRLRGCERVLCLLMHISCTFLSPTHTYNTYRAQRCGKALRVRIIYVCLRSTTRIYNILYNVYPSHRDESPQGYTAEMLAELNETTYGSAERQLYTLFWRMMDHKDVDKDDVMVRCTALMEGEFCATAVVMYLPAIFCVHSTTIRFVKCRFWATVGRDQFTRWIEIYRHVAEGWIRRIGLYMAYRFGMVPYGYWFVTVQSILNI